MKDINTKWATNETLLQSYRAIFITTQSIFIAIGVFSIDRLVLNIIIFFISVLTIWWVWFPIVKARHLIVDFYKYSIELNNIELEALFKICENEKEYLDLNREKKQEADTILKIKKHWRQTRKKIDLVLPILFTIIWVILFSLTIKLI